jgi:hypothetical protein
MIITTNKSARLRSENRDHWKYWSIVMVATLLKMYNRVVYNELNLDIYLDFKLFSY